MALLQQQRGAPAERGNQCRVADSLQTVAPL